MHSKTYPQVSNSTLFEYLDCLWEFAPGPTPSSCWLTFRIDFAFKSPLYRHAATMFFEEVRALCATAFSVTRHRNAGGSAHAGCVSSAHSDGVRTVVAGAAQASDGACVSFWAKLFFDNNNNNNNNFVALNRDGVIVVTNSVLSSSWWRVL